MKVNKDLKNELRCKLEREKIGMKEKIEMVEGDMEKESIDNVIGIMWKNGIEIEIVYGELKK